MEHSPLPKYLPTVAMDLLDDALAQADEPTLATVTKLLFWLHAQDKTLRYYLGLLF